MTECVLHFLKTQKNGSSTAIEEPAHLEETAASPYQDLTLRCLACELPGDPFPGLVIVQRLSMDRLAVLRLQEVVGKAEHLKTIPIADDPQIELMPFPVGGLDLDEAHQAGLLGNGLIPVR